MSSWARRPKIWEDIDEATWGSWHWQQQHRVRDLEILERILELNDEERETFLAARSRFRVAITPHYLALMDGQDPNCPLRMQAVPQSGELEIRAFELEDPLAEEAHSPCKGVTHRYPDRVLLYVSHNCPMYCRHCTRKRKVADPYTTSSRADIEAALEYIRRTPTARDVIVSGGDPLTLSDERLGEILRALRAIEHVEVIRLGTRNPVTLPQRITPQLLEILRDVRPVYLHTHFNHVNELGQDARKSLLELLDAGCVLGNQMVLLKGVNDSPEAVMQLNRELLKVGCRPYYMLQADMAEGITHFRTPISKGLEIMDYLRGRIGGMGIPHFVVDLPGGGGKIELTPDYLEGKYPHPDGTRWVFRNGFGATFDFVEPD